ncbi:hypothetical protein [Kribbella amoyensis]|nr:hypothetical protein [Kribbella amoyensis]
MAAEPVGEQCGPAQVVEIACDESGFSGTNLLDQDARVLAHASVRIDDEAAADCVALLRASSPYPVREYKSAQLLRPDQRPVLSWFLGPDGPLLGQAAVQLTDKRFLVAGRISGLFAGELSYVTGTSLDRDHRAVALARVLHHQGPATFGPVRWKSLLKAFISLLRAKNHGQYLTRTEAFLAVAAEYEADEALPISEPLRLIRTGRPRLLALQDRLFDDRTLIPPLEVMIPALLETSLHWAGPGRQVAVIHDEQSALTVHRIAQLNQLLTVESDSLLTLEQADSRTDPRVQVADLLAGAARQIATAELRGEGDPTLTTLLRPYLGPHAIWSHPTSWSRLSA